jgi:hypothetical protein
VSFRRPAAAVLLLGVVLAPPTRARASDGVVEINDACATSTGCVSGDGPGYPVTLGAPGSYRLTSNLAVPVGANGIEVGNGVSIDLGQFEIAGPVSCLLGCPAPTAGTGIVAAVAGGNQCAVSNGKVRGFGLDGIRLGLQARIERVTLTDVARDAISVSGGSLVVENLVNRAGENGIQFTVSSLIAPSLYRDNTVANTAGPSVVQGRASGPNVCPDGTCGTTGMRFFYLTTTTHMGAAADTACAAGYHMASLWEVLDPSGLEYNRALGRTGADTGDGPPSRFTGGEAWIRTGLDTGDTSSTSGLGNCNAWASASASDSGSTAQLDWPWASGDASPQTVTPWTTSWDQCITANPVWCVQD